MRYEILKSGSKGNAVIIEDLIMIDCGVPYRLIAPYADRLKIVLLTHIHGDHFKPTTVGRLAAMRPALRWACGCWMVNRLIAAGVDKRNIDILPMSYTNDYNLLKVKAIETKHKVQNCAYKLEINGERLFYATDLNTLEGIEAKNYDLYMLEANYEECEIQERIARKEASGEYVYERQVINNHLSYEKASEWLYNNMGNNSKYIFLHMHEED